MDKRELVSTNINTAMETYRKHMIECQTCNQVGVVDDCDHNPNRAWALKHFKEQGWRMVWYSVLQRMEAICPKCLQEEKERTCTECGKPVTEDEGNICDGCSSQLCAGAWADLQG